MPWKCVCNNCDIKFMEKRFKSSFTEKTNHGAYQKQKLIAPCMPILTTNCDVETLRKTEASEPYHRLLQYYCSKYNFCNFAHKNIMPVRLGIPARCSGRQQQFLDAQGSKRSACICDRSLRRASELQNLSDETFVKITCDSNVSAATPTAPGKLADFR